MTPGVVTVREVPEPGATGLYRLREWREEFGVVAGITSVADGDYGLLSSQPAAGVIERWVTLPRRVGAGFDGIVVSRQVHGRQIRQDEGGATPGWRVFDGYDGHTTTQPGLLLGISVADCIPVYLFAPRTGRLALAHAGWRGTAAGVLDHALAAVAPSPEDRPDLVLHLGVGICGDCYEVGPEVVDALGLAPLTAPTGLDLRDVLARLAAEAGVTRVTRSAWCARHDAAFHSHRRDGEKAGRMVAFLGCPLG